MKTLTEIMNQYLCDKGTDPKTIWAHGYSNTYGEIFQEIRNKPIKMLEIGVCDPRMPGASLKAWYDYFPSARIVGFDIIDASEFNNERVATFKGDQANRDDLRRFVEKHGGEYDIIIDDGSHQDEHQQISLGFLFKFVASGGLYIIEDCHVSPGTISLARQFKDTPRECRHERIKTNSILPEEMNYLCECAEIDMITDKLIIFRKTV